MVWNTTQSAFYKAIEDFNNREKTGEFHGENCNKNRDDRHDECPPPCSPKNNEAAGCDIPQNRCPRCPANRGGLSGTLSGILSDNDMLLIAGLIFLLYHQNADKKLILALAFVLLS